MADPKAYVMVDNFDVDNVFDKAYKTSSKLKKAMKTAAEKAIDSSPKLTTTAPKPDNKLPQFYVSGTLSKLTQEDGGKHGRLRAKVEMVLGTWPDKSILGRPHGGAPMDISNPKKIDDDVEFLAAAVVTDLMKKEVIGAMVKKLP